jgi:putative transposase
MNTSRHNYQLRDLYQLCGISKQGHYKAVRRQLDWQQKQELIVGLIQQVRETHPAMGLRTMYELCEPEAIGRDAFINLGLCYGFRVKTFRNTSRTTFSSPYSRYPNLLIGKTLDDINQVWSSDLTYFKVGEKHFYITFIMDVYTRRIIGYSVADNMRAENNVLALKMALSERAVKNYHSRLIHHSDRGGQYISQEYTSILASCGIRISMCNQVYENAHIERVNGTIKNQYLNHWNITTFQQLIIQLRRAVDTYNQKRPHSALDGLTPLAFEQKIKELDDKDKPKMTVWTASPSSLSNPDQCLLQF